MKKKTIIKTCLLTFVGVCLASCSNQAPVVEEKYKVIRDNDMPSYVVLNGLNGSYKVGEKVNFTITINDQTQGIENVYKNGEVITPSSGNYTFDMPKQDVTIKVNTKTVKYSIKTNLPDGVTISGIDVQRGYDEGEEVTFTLNVTNEDMTIGRVFYNNSLLDMKGSNKGNNFLYRFKMPKKNVEIKAEIHDKVMELYETFIELEKTKAVSENEFANQIFTVNGFFLSLSSVDAYNHQYLTFGVSDDDVSYDIVNAYIKAGTLEEDEIELNDRIVVSGDICNYYGNFEFKDNPNSGVNVEVSKAEGKDPGIADSSTWNFEEAKTNLDKAIYAKDLAHHNKSNADNIYEPSYVTLTPTTGVKGSHTFFLNNGDDKISFNFSLTDYLQKDPRKAIVLDQYPNENTFTVTGFVIGLDINDQSQKTFIFVVTDVTIAQEKTYIPFVFLTARSLFPNDQKLIYGDYVGPNLSNYDIIIDVDSDVISLTKLVGVVGAYRVKVNENIGSTNQATFKVSLVVDGSEKASIIESYNLLTLTGQGTEANPYTPDDGYNIASSLLDNIWKVKSLAPLEIERPYVQGIVKNVRAGSSYYYFDLVTSSTDKTFSVYKASVPEKEKDNKHYLSEGDKVLVKGAIRNFTDNSNVIYEMAGGGYRDIVVEMPQIISLEHQDISWVAPTSEDYQITFESGYKDGKVQTGVPVVFNVKASDPNKKILTALFNEKILEEEDGTYSFYPFPGMKTDTLNIFIGNQNEYMESYNVSEIADINGWENKTSYKVLTVASENTHCSISTNNANEQNGFYSESNEEWRIYGVKDHASKVTISIKDSDKQITSLYIEYGSKTNGALKFYYTKDGDEKNEVINSNSQYKIPLDNLKSIDLVCEKNPLDPKNPDGGQAQIRKIFVLFEANA